MKIELTTEKWNQHKQPTVGESWFFIKKGKQVWFSIIEQGWTKTGVYLRLQKIKQSGGGIGRRSLNTSIQ